jgi:archaellum component FlaC
MQTAVQGPARPSTPAPDRPSTPASVLLGGQGPPELTRPQQITIAASSQSEAITIPTPRTAADIDALKARREELSNQLQSVDSRRSKLINQLKQTGDATATQGLEARLALLDARQLQLETDIAQTGQQLTSPEAGRIVSIGTPPVFAGLRSKEVMTLSVLSILLVFFPLAFSVARSVWKRSNRPGPAPGVFTETAQRLERLEASVDAIAIEIERVSEGQRFVTKLLSESQPTPQLGAGQRTPETVRGS